MWSFDRVQLPVDEIHFEALGRVLITDRTAHSEAHAPVRRCALSCFAPRACHLSLVQGQGLFCALSTKQALPSMMSSSRRTAVCLFCTAAVLSNNALIGRMSVFQDVPLERHAMLGCTLHSLPTACSYRMHVAVVFCAPAVYRVWSHNPVCHPGDFSNTYMNTKECSPLLRLSDLRLIA